MEYYVATENIYWHIYKYINIFVYMPIGKDFQNILRERKSQTEEKQYESSGPIYEK
jgi:hypothetical protein